MKWRGWIVALHRDMGYFFTGALLLYAVSGLAVNHVDDWNPSFVIERRAVTLDLPSEASQVTERAVLANLEPLGEAGNLRGFDFPVAARDQRRGLRRLHVEVPALTPHPGTLGSARAAR